jgi:hypothetical protein
MWHPHIYGRKWRRFVGRIIYDLKLPNLDNIQATSVFDIKKCIFCEIEKFRVNENHLKNLYEKRDGDKEFNMLFMKGLYDYGKKPGEFKLDVYIAKKRESKKLTASNRIKKIL